MASDGLTIGQFSRMTHLSAKALRFYHREGLLAPASVDPSNGYREYRVDQLPTAQVISRLRSLDMPIHVLREVLRAPDVVDRNQLIARHLEHMEAQLEDSRNAVASLRRLLTAKPAAIGVEYRSVPAQDVLLIDSVIDVADLGAFFTGAMSELDAAVATSRAATTGPRGGLWPAELFLDERGLASVFRPVDADTVRSRPDGRVRLAVLPPAELAIAVHVGSDVDVDTTYGALGTHVTRHELGVDGPIRESYVVSELDRGVVEPVTEIGWPIFRTAR